MPIAPIPAIPALPALPAASSAAATGAGSTAGSNSFSTLLSNAVSDLQASQSTASADEAQSAAGQGNLADTMIAASKASLDTQVTTDLLDKAVSSFNQVMSMSF